MTDAAHVKIIPQFLPLFDRSHPAARKMFKIIRGGRGGMKSWQVARALCWKGYENREKLLCAREFQNSMADSVMALMEEQARAIGLGGFYRSYETTMLGQNMSEVLFKGLAKNINSLKSIEGVKRLWIEEAQTISKKSIETLFPSIRQEDIEIILTYNPDLETDPVHQFVKSLPPEYVYLAEVNADDNPFLPTSLRIQREIALRAIAEARTDAERVVAEESYRHIWLGQCRQNSLAQIFAGKTTLQRFDAVKTERGYEINGKPAHGPYFGVDWGFSISPLAGLRCWICDDCVYIDYEIYEYGCELDDTPTALRRIPLLDKHTVRADSARPESVAYCRRSRKDKEGNEIGSLNVVSVDKWPDSIEDGISVLKAFRKIVIHERCKNMAHEAAHYSFKVDQKTGDILPEIVDKFNDLWDSLRYALAPYIKKSGKGKGFVEFARSQAEKQSGH